ncbi:MAG: AAA family ATPase [Planctomycetes bacterium]|nr:AAA family ATPase [Planctomycetota bacterium]
MKVVLSNYRCFRQATLNLTPLTVIVGPNASGKSTIVSALDPALSIGERDVWQRRSGTNAVVRRERDGVVSGFDSASGWLGMASFRFQRLQLDIGKVRQPNQVQSASLLDVSGVNLTNVFATLPRKVQGQLSEEFCRFVPVFSDVNARPGDTGQHRLVFQDRWNPDVWYEPGEVSDGSLLTLAFLTLQYQQPSVDVIALEELERGLHPYLVGELVSLLRRLARGEVGRGPMNVVLTTHSASLLEFALPEEVRLLCRQDDGSVDIREVPSGTAEWRQTFEEYGRSFGAVWLSGGLGGVP